MLARNHVSRRPVRQAVKITRTALNQALDAAEPRLEKAAGDVEDLTRDVLAAVRRSSLERLGQLKQGADLLGKRVRKQLPKRMPRQRIGKLALLAAGVIIVSIAIFR